MRGSSDSRAGEGWRSGDEGWWARRRAGGHARLARGCRRTHYHSAAQAAQTWLARWMHGGARGSTGDQRFFRQAALFFFVFGRRLEVTEKLREAIDEGNGAEPLAVVDGGV